MKKKITALLLAFMLLLLSGCGADDTEQTPVAGDVYIPPESSWSVQYFLTPVDNGGTLDGVAIYIVASTSDLPGAIDNYDRISDIDTAATGENGGETSFRQALMQYDEAFFEQSALVLCMLTLDSTAYVPRITNVNAMGVMTDITMVIDRSGGDDATPATWAFIIEVERIVVDSDVNFYIY